MPTAKRAWVAATLDTKLEEAQYACDLLEKAGLPVTLVDLSTKGSTPLRMLHSSPSGKYISPLEIAKHHALGESAVFSADRGTAIAAMTDAFERFVKTQNDIGGLLGLGGSGGTAMITRAMRALPIGTPKVMVSTMASGNVAAYVGSSDITLVYSVTDAAGLNRISRQVLGNAAHALAGMMLRSIPYPEDARHAVGISMFGVTTSCVEQLVCSLTPRYECLVFHATGTGGRSMEKLLDDGKITGL